MGIAGFFYGIAGFFYLGNLSVRKGMTGKPELAFRFPNWKLLKA